MMMERMRRGLGFIAALDQSGGSTPKTLVNYGLSPSTWSSDEEMFDLIHAMRCRILRSPAFTREKILAAILFERTMDGMADGRPVPQLLIEKGIVPFLKIDKGLEAERDGVELMSPVAGLECTLSRAIELGVFGTKARSVIRAANPKGIAAAVEQQFEVGKTVAAAGLLPILEPEFALDAPDRAAGEEILKQEILSALAKLPEDSFVILKLSIPVKPNAYRDLVHHPRVARLAALSGGYSRQTACEELAKNEGMIASFSRALLSDLRVSMSDAVFDATLARVINQIFRASTHLEEDVNSTED